MLCAVHGRVGILKHISEFFDINVQTKSKAETALHLASYYGHLEMVEHLLGLGARVDLKNEYGETPIEAAGHSKKPGAAECTKALVAVRDSEKREAQRKAAKRAAEGVGAPQAKRQAL